MICVNPSSYQSTPALPLRFNRLNPAGSRLNAVGLQHSLTPKDLDSETAFLQSNNPPFASTCSGPKLPKDSCPSKPGFDKEINLALRVTQIFLFYLIFLCNKLSKAVLRLSNYFNESNTACSDVHFHQNSGPKKTVSACFKIPFAATKDLR